MQKPTDDTHRDTNLWVQVLWVQHAWRESSCGTGVAGLAAVEPPVPLARWTLTDPSAYLSRACGRQVDACMVATGRVPNTKGLGLEEMGIQTFRGFVQVGSRSFLVEAEENGHRTRLVGRGRQPVLPVLLLRQASDSPALLLLSDGLGVVTHRWMSACVCWTRRTARWCPTSTASVTPTASTCSPTPPRHRYDLLAQPPAIQQRRHSVAGRRCRQERYTGYGPICSTILAHAASAQVRLLAEHSPKTRVGAPPIVRTD